MRVLALLFAMNLLHGQAFSGTNPGAKIALHIQTLNSKQQQNPCNYAEKPPCNDGQSSLIVHGNLNTGYFVYVLILDGNVTYFSDPAGIMGATFGISYDAALNISWHSCGNVSENPSATPLWPASGSGNVITWGTCQNTPAVGDVNNNVTAVLGYFYATAADNATLSITPNFALQTPAFQVSSCQSEQDDLMYPRAAGKVAFGSTAGYDPCKGPLSAFSNFQALSGQDLASVLIKITDLRGKSRHAVLLGPSAVEDPAQLKTYQRLDFDYGNDVEVAGIQHPKFSISSGEVQGVINAISSLPAVSDGGVDANGRLSIGLFTTSGTNKQGFESIVDATNGSAFFASIRGGFTTLGVQDGMDQIACSLGMEGSPPSDISSSVTVAISGFRLEHKNNVFIGSVTVTNSSTTTFSVPVTLLLNEGTDARILNYDGVACRFKGPTYFNLDVGPSFVPGEAVEVMVRVQDINEPKFQFQPAVYAGPGVR